MGNETCAIIATTYDGYHSVTCTVTVNIQSDNGNDVSGDNGNNESGNSGSNETERGDTGSTGDSESGSGDAGNTGNGSSTGDGQITAPSTGRDTLKSIMIPVAVFMMLALSGVAVTAYTRRKRTVR